MKKTLSAVAAAGILLISATSFAAEAIDAGGKAGVSIAAPSTAIARTASVQVSLDSAGVFTAAAPSVMATVSLRRTGQVTNLCLDSECKAKLSM